MLNIRCLAVLTFAAVAVCPAAQAHHAAGAVFTDEDIEVEGVVTEYNLVNPHVNIMLNVTDESGAETLWMVTGPAAPPMRRWGWTPETLRPGQLIRFAGKSSRTGAPMLLIESAEIQGGRFVELDPADGSIIRRLQEAPDNSQAPDASLSIALTLEEYDTVRTIHMTGTAPGAPSMLGHSVGRWEGDTLVVNSTHFSPQLFRQGIRLSEDLEIIEHITPSADGSRLLYEATATDPAAFVEPIEFSAQWIYVPGVTVEPYDCIDG